MKAVILDGSFVNDPTSERVKAALTAGADINAMEEYSGAALHKAALGNREWWEDLQVTRYSV